jgi:RNA polymerase sigma-70 factor (sigma-E family)
MITPNAIGAPEQLTQVPNLFGSPVRSVRVRAQLRELEAMTSENRLHDDFCSWAASRQERLLRAAYLMCGDRQLAEDLLQEAFIKVAMRWEKVGSENPDGYVRRILYRDNVSWWRRRREIPVETLRDSARPGDPDAAERVVAVRSALASLTSKQRAVLVLRFFEDLTEREAAEVLGVSVGTVKSQTSVALARLRRSSPELRDFVCTPGGDHG